MEQNTPQPRISLSMFESELEHANPEWLLNAMTYLHCVDGCRPDEITQRFAMLEAHAQKVGITPERLAQWHKLYGDLWADDAELFRDAVFQLDRNHRASLTVLQFMSEVKPRKADYLIKPYLPKGMLTVLGGVSGVGKTWLALYWAAKISRRFKVDEAGAVYYFTQENDPAIVLQPRLEALGAEMSRIAIQRFDDTSSGLTLDDRRIEAAAVMIPPRLVIFDPIQSYLGVGVEMNKANEVRPILDWLGRFAQQYNCAVVLVSHMSKPGANNSEALDRLLGSSDFRNAARSIVIVGTDPEEPDVRVFAHAKNSIGQPGPSQRYRVGDDGVTMLGECNWTANEIIRAPSRGAGRPESTAKQDLQALLQPRGWATGEEVNTLCEEKGYNIRTMRRAAKELQLKCLRVGARDSSRTWWLLPDTPKEAVAINGQNALLQE